MTVTDERLEEWKALARMLRHRVQFLTANMPPRNRDEVPSLTAAAEALDSLIAEVERLREALRFYANPEIYKAHPHGPAFDKRDLSFHARTVLQEPGES